ncbi:MAG: M23 family metallopeptidase [Candidatus Omnitrophica bacterium]|nr:M23 family metallopeptidase [Candidatus Omnitrophota bacterium]
MKKIFLFLLIVLPACLVIALYFLDKDYFLCPIDYKGGIFVRSDSRGDGFFGSPRSGNRLHEGIDLFAQIGTPVLAVRSGKVVISKVQHKGMGNYIVMRHPGNLVTIYGHLSKVYARRGDFVRQGKVIGEVGKTGNANYRDIQPHLHFEVREAGIPADPLEYLQ